MQQYRQQFCFFRDTPVVKTATRPPLDIVEATESILKFICRVLLGLLVIVQVAMAFGWRP